MENTTVVEPIDDALLKDKINLDKSYMMYTHIISKKLPCKFKYLDDWRLKESRLLMKEAVMFEYNLDDRNSVKKVQTYRTFKRGTIVRVDFGVNLGSEMSQVHFGIVLNKYDSQKNNVLTVIPLTSAYSRFNLDLGDLIVETLVKKIEEEMTLCAIESEHDSSITVTRLSKLDTLIKYYKYSIKHTYACCSLITTISKTRLLKPINEYDIIGTSICSDEVLNKIEAELCDKFTTK